MDRRNFINRSGLAGMAGLGAASLALQSFAPATTAQVSDTRFNVRKYGAKGDDKTPDSAAIQKAIDAAGKVNGTVWFPAGHYRCHDLKVPANVNLQADPAWLYRDEPVGAVLHLDDENAECVLDVTEAYGVHVYGLMLQGLPKAQKPIHGIYLNNPEKWSPKENTLVFDDVKVCEFTGCGIYLKRIWLFIIRHSHFMGNHMDGVRIMGWDGFVTDNQFSGNRGNGFGCEGCGATVMFTANRVEWNGGYGLYLTSGDDWNVTGNSFDRNCGAGLCAENMSTVAVTGNIFRRCGKDSNQLSEGEHSCQVRLDNCRGITMTGNSCLAGQDDGGVGLFTPQIGFIIHKLAYSVITSNTLWHGYMQEMLIDQGEHTELVLKDNVGCPIGK